MRCPPDAPKLASRIAGPQLLQSGLAILMLLTALGLLVETVWPSWRGVA